MPRYCRATSLALMLLTASTAVAQEAPVSLEVVARIGCLDCDGPALLTNVQGLAIAGARIHVLDASDPHVRLFDDQGRVVRAFGRSGSGPGEFRFPMHIRVRSAGDFEVFDYGLGRLTRFDSLGTPVATRTVNLGVFPSLSSRADNPFTYFATSDFGDSSQHVKRLAVHDAVITRLPAPGVVFPIDQRSGMVSRPVLAARPRTGFAVGDGSEDYRIRVLTEDGSHLHEIVRNVSLVRKTSEELAADSANRGRLRQLAVERMRGARPRAAPISEFRRHFSAMEYDDEGRLWVRTRRGDPAMTVFDLFDKTGKYLGELRVPGQLGRFALAGGRLAAATTRDGVPYVQIWRVK